MVFRTGMCHGDQWTEHFVMAAAWMQALSPTVSLRRTAIGGLRMQDRNVSIAFHLPITSAIGPVLESRGVFSALRETGSTTRAIGSVSNRIVFALLTMKKWVCSWDETVVREMKG